MENGLELPREKVLDEWVAYLEEQPGLNVEDAQGAGLLMRALYRTLHAPDPMYERAALTTSTLFSWQRAYLEPMGLDVEGIRRARALLHNFVCWCVRKGYIEYDKPGVPAPIAKLNQEPWPGIEWPHIEGDHS